MNMLTTCVIIQALNNFSVYTPKAGVAVNKCLFYVSVWLLSFGLDETQQNTP